MEKTQPVTLFDNELADLQQNTNVLDKAQAEKIFSFFKGCSLFRWIDANNDCEDRANAICLLLNNWNFANNKAWVFGGDFRGKVPGHLNNKWNYHVAASLPVQEQNKIVHYVIDPATSPALIPIEDWALQITENGTSYHFTKNNDYYIFPERKISKDNWHKGDRRNYNWTMQGLSGINGVSAKGKAQLVFQKKKVKKTEDAFKTLMKNQPI